MKANEFRIGNIVYVKGEVDELNGIADNDYYSTDYGHGVWDDDIEPIPLTEGWLLKLGFEKLRDNLFVLNELLEFNANVICIDEGRGLIPLNHIKHIHQLQNLYFALTGEELEE
jgi:hypothetical protein